MITIEKEKMKKGTDGYLGKLRSNFIGTEFYIFDTGKNPQKAKNQEEVRKQLGYVEYEANVLGSKGPRRMKVVLPKVNKEGRQSLWQSSEVNID